MEPRLHAITLVAVIAIGCGRTRTPDDTIVMVIESTMTTADPRFAVSGYDGKLAKLIVPGLTIVESPTLAPELGLASRVERIDALTYEVEVRRDAKFSDGTPVVAADVACTYAYLLDPNTESVFHKAMTDRFTRVEAIGTHAVRFHLKAPLATFVTDIDFGIFACANGLPEPHRAIGAGPYAVREITQRHVLLEANPHYYGGVAKTRFVEIKFVKDMSARLLMLVGGSADLVQNAARYDLLDQITPRGISLATERSVFLSYLLMNNEHPKLRDRRVRQAIALAIDREALVGAKFAGRAQLADGLLPAHHWAYVPGTPWRRDVARAKQLLDAAGFSDPPGDEPRMRLVYKTSSDAFRVAVARTIIAQLAEVGIEVELRAFEFPTFFSDIKKGSYELATMQTGELTEPDFYSTYFHSSWIPTEKNPDGYNRWRYRNAEVDRLAEAGRRELDVAKRKAIYSQIRAILVEDMPVVPLYHEDNFALSGPALEGYRLTPNARLSGLRFATKRPRD